MQPIEDVILQLRTIERVVVQLPDILQVEEHHDAAPVAEWMRLVLPQLYRAMLI